MGITNIYKVVENPIKDDINSLIMQLSRAKNVREVKRLERIIMNKLKRKGTPYIDEDTAHFIYHGSDEKDISIVGDWNKWKPGVDTMIRINPRSSMRHFFTKFPINARLSYRFVVNGNESINDPLNPNVLQEVFGANTFLRMPGYRGIPYAGEPKRNVPKGKLIDMLAEGNVNVAPRIVQIYIPHGMKRHGKAHYLYVNDGAQAVTIGKFVNVLDNLFYHEPNVPKTIVVFVPPIERHNEYMMNKPFAEWYANSLVKQVERKTRFRSDAALRTVQGASLGGLFAMFLGLEYYKLFRNIAAQSPSFWIEDHAIVNLFAKRKALPLRIYLQTGTINDAEIGARKMLRVLQAKEYDVIYRESNESHNWANWSARYADIVRWSAAK